MTLALRLRAYAPFGADLGPLPGPTSYEVSFPLNDTGAIRLDYGSAAPRSSLMGQPCEIAVEVSTDGGATYVEPPNGRFLYLRDGRDPLRASDAYAVEGPSLVWLLSKARVRGGVDGKRDFTAATPGMILRTLLDEAKGRGALSGIEVSSFTALLDSAGAPWSTQTILSISTGTDLQAVLLDLADRGLVDFRFVGRSLQVFAADTVMVVDRTVGANPVALRWGVDLTEAPFRRTWEGIVTDVDVLGDAGVSLALTNPGAVAPWGRWEGFLTQSGVSDPGTMTVLAQSELERSAAPRVEYTRGLEFSGAQYLPWRDYAVGEFVFSQTDGQAAPVRLRVRQVTLTAEAARVRGNIVLNDMFAERDVAIARRVAGIVGGATSDTGVGGGTPTDPNDPNAVDQTVPSAPAGVLASSAAYNDPAGNPWAQVTTTWTPVTTNTDASPVTDLDHYEVQTRTGPRSTSLGTPVALSPARAAEDYTGRFDRRGKPWGWVGGDGGDSTRVGGRDVFLWSDTNWGASDADGRISQWQFTHNSLTVLDPGDVSSFTALRGMPNLLSSADATMDAATGWTWRADANATVARVTTVGAPKSGAGALAITATATGDAVATTALGSGTGWLPVTAGQAYTVMAHVRPRGGVGFERGVGVGLRFWDSAGNLISTVQGSDVSAGLGPTGAHQRKAQVITAPAGAARAAVVIRIVGLTAASAYWVDNVGVFTGPCLSQSFAAPGRGNASEAMISPEDVDQPLTDMLWTDAVWTGPTGKMHALVVQFSPTAGGTFQRRTFLATWTAALEYEGAVLWSDTDDVQWNTGVYDDGTWLYVMGVWDRNPTKDTYLMRVPSGNYAGAKSWWTGAAWSATRASAAVVHSGSLVSLNGIANMGGAYQSLGVVFGSGDVRRYTAPALTGPWTAQETVYTVPDVGGGTVAYFPQFHPSLDTADGAVMSVSLNTVTPGPSTQERSYLYTPRFFRGAANPVVPATPATGWPSTWDAVDPGQTVHYASGFGPGLNAQCRVRAADQSGHVSTWTESAAVFTGQDLTGPPKPSAPIVAGQFSGLRIDWDGLNANGGAMPADFMRVDVHVSDVSDFTPSTFTRRDAIQWGAGATSVQGLYPGRTYYVRLVAYDRSGNASAASEVGSAGTERLDDPDLPDKLITGAKIATNTIAVRNLTVAAFDPNMVPNGGMEDVEGGAPTRWRAAFWKGAGNYVLNVGVETVAPLAGSTSMKISTTVADAVEVATPSMTVTPGATYYAAVRFRTSRVLAANVIAVRLFTAPVEADLFSGDPLTSTITIVGWTAGSLTLATMEGSVAIPEGHRYAVLSFYPDLDAGGAYTSWLDDVEVRKIVGEAAIANASIGSAKIKDLAVSSAKIADVSAGKITAGTMTAQVILSGSFRTAAAGQRMELGPYGLFSYDSSGNTKVEIWNTGYAKFTGDITASNIVASSFQTAATGARVAILGTENRRLFMFPDAGQWDDVPGLRSDMTYGPLTITGGKRNLANSGGIANLSLAAADSGDPNEYGNAKLWANRMTLTGEIYIQGKIFRPQVYGVDKQAINPWGGWSNGQSLGNQPYYSAPEVHDTFIQGLTIIRGVWANSVGVQDGQVIGNVGIYQRPVRTQIVACFVNATANRTWLEINSSGDVTIRGIPAGGLLAAVGGYILIYCATSLYDKY